MSQLPITAARRLVLGVCFAATAMLTGCVPEAENEVVIYTALDQEFSAPILAGFARAQDDQIQPQAKFDVESTKTVGLVNRLIGERDRVVCDVFWNNEILHTIRLQKKGLLAPHDWPVPSDWPVIASDKTWCGFAARARVLIVNTNLLPDPAERPHSVMELADPKWKDRCAMAKPLFGTTATHAAVLHHELGADRAEKFFREVAANARILSGNKQVAQSVALGQIAWGITDTDDAIIEIEAGLPAAMIFPDQQPAESGALRIPNTVAILKGAPHPIAAAQLANHLISPETEDRLAMGDSAQIPLFREVPTRPRVLPEEGVRWMDVDFEAAAESWDEVAGKLESIFEL
jgi:iron(III) transport system substrate-binding protein